MDRGLACGGSTIGSTGVCGGSVDGGSSFALSIPRGGTGTADARESVVEEGFGGGRVSARALLRYFHFLWSFIQSNSGGRVVGEVSTVEGRRALVVGGVPGRWVLYLGGQTVFRGMHLGGWRRDPVGGGSTGWNCSRIPSRGTISNVGSCRLGVSARSLVVGVVRGAGLLLAAFLGQFFASWPTPVHTKQERGWFL